MAVSAGMLRTIDSNPRMKRSGGCAAELVALFPRLVCSFTPEFPEPQNRILGDGVLGAYASNDGLVFYTRGHRLTSTEAVYVHRRLGGDHAQKTDLRITMTADREHGEGAAFDGVMTPTWQRAFQASFEAGDHWRLFSQLVKAKLTEAPSR